MNYKCNTFVNETDERSAKSNKKTLLSNIPMSQKPQINLSEIQPIYHMSPQGQNPESKSSLRLQISDTQSLIRCDTSILDCSQANVTSSSNIKKRLIRVNSKTNFPIDFFADKCEKNQISKQEESLTGDNETPSLLKKQISAFGRREQLIPIPTLSETKCKSPPLFPQSRTNTKQRTILDVFNPQNKPYNDSEIASPEKQESSKGQLPLPQTNFTTSTTAEVLKDSSDPQNQTIQIRIHPSSAYLPKRMSLTRINSINKFNATGLSTPQNEFIELPNSQINLQSSCASPDLNLEQCSISIQNQIPQPLSAVQRTPLPLIDLTDRSGSGNPAYQIEFKQFTSYLDNQGKNHIEQELPQFIQHKPISSHPKSAKVSSGVQSQKTSALPSDFLENKRESCTNLQSNFPTDWGCSRQEPFSLPQMAAENGQNNQKFRPFMIRRVSSSRTLQFDNGNGEQKPDVPSRVGETQRIQEDNNFIFQQQIAQAINVQVSGEFAKGVQSLVQSKSSESTNAGIWSVDEFGSGSHDFSFSQY